MSPGVRTGARALILGIDPGTRTVGYGLIERAGCAHRYAYLECGVIEVSVVSDLAHRLHVVAQAISEIIEEFAPTAMAIEKAFHGKNAASALKLGQARGAIMLLASQHALPTFEYAPARIKQVVVGHGRATKQQVQDRVQMLLRLHNTPRSDAADALAIALCHGQVGDAVIHQEAQR
jgi:crossover junction endodeoxyribonuclease RuvC